MNELMMTDFVNRVLSTRERVRFADADPYGHLSSGEYVNMMISHRLQALQDQLQCDPLRLARTSRVAFVLREMSLSFLVPSAVGDRLQVASWTEDLRPRGFTAPVVISGEDDHVARAVATLHFVSVSTEDGRPVTLPDALPTAGDSDALARLPMVGEYLQNVNNLPREWAPAVA